MQPAEAKVVLITGASSEKEERAGIPPETAAERVLELMSH